MTNEEIREQALQLTAYARYGAVGIEEYTAFIADEIATEEVTIGDYNVYLAEISYETYMDIDTVHEIISCMEPFEAFRLGCFSDFNWSDDYFQFDGYGNMKSFTTGQVEREMESDKDFLIWYAQENLVDDDEAEEVITECNKLLLAGY